MDPDTLYAMLHPDDGEHTYAIIDGASCEELLEKLAEYRPESICLYAGELEPGVEKVAPYLVLLPPEHPFSDWLETEGFGKHWGIFARSASNIRALRKHFRTFLRVRSPEGKMLYFRFYDPRVLKTYLPTCNARELATVFGPLSAYLFEDGKPPGIARVKNVEGVAQKEFIPPKP